MPLKLMFLNLFMQISYRDQNFGGSFWLLVLWKLDPAMPKLSDFKFS